MSRLLFQVCHCWSEEDGFPGTELMFHTAVTKGWHSARFTKFPVEVGLQFEGLVSIKSLHFLCHEFMVPTRVDVMVCEPDETQLATAMFPTYEKAPWQRLGHFFFGSNEDKQFKARELKTVHINVPTVFVRLLLDKCHLNPYNFYNQVSLVAIEAIGEMLKPLRLLTPIRKPKLPEMDLKALRPPSTGPAGGPPVASSLDPVTAQKIKDFEAQKTVAVQNEEFDVAKQLKVKIDALKSVASRLQQLETDKRQAIAQEDYDRAKALKMEIEAVRRQAMGIATAAGMPAGKMRARQASYPREGVPLGGAMVEGPLAVRDLFDEVTAGGNVMLAHDDVPVGGKKQAPAVDDEAILNITDPFGLKKRASVVLESIPRDGQEEETKSPEQSVSDVVVSAKGTPELGMQGLPFDSAGRPQWEVDLFAALSELNQGAHYATDELPIERRSESRLFAEAFGSQFMECMLSRHWQLRELTLKAIALHIIDQHPFGVGSNRLFELCCSFLVSRGCGLKDFVANVFYAACDLLETLLHLEVDLSPSQMQAAASRCLRELVVKSADVNARTKDVSLQLLKLFAQSPNFGPLAVFGAVMSTIEGSGSKKGTWRTTLAKLYLLFLLIEAYGVQVMDRSKGMDVDAMMAKAVGPALQHQNAEVRQEAINVIALLATELPDRSFLDPYLRGLKPALLSSIEQAIAAAQEAAVVPANRPPSPHTVQMEKMASIQKLEEQIEQLPDDLGERREEGGHETGEAEEPEEEDFTTCPFCGKQDVAWVEASLDQHFEEHCPWLIACEKCGQVVEIPFLQEHQSTNCEAFDPLDAAAATPGRVCPLCNGLVDATLDPNDGWIAHLLMAPGCFANPKPLDI
eukprot:GGOE01041524.1.p1 GENE.GGOE01041524.1~~GGOE01041524.1.p1  ORF type:complete len:857 (-),score=246.28 GGOE01041524.1:242-2812(-)